MNYIQNNPAQAALEQFGIRKRAQQEADAREQDRMQAQQVDEALRNYARDTGLRGTQPAGMRTATVDAPQMPMPSNGRPEGAEGYSVGQASTQGRGGYAPAPQAASQPAKPAAQAMPAPQQANQQPSQPVGQQVAQQPDQQSVMPMMAQRDPAFEALVSQPGTGRMAMDMVNQRKQAQEKAEEMAVTALAAGDFTTFDYWKRRSGLQLPPGMEQNQQQAQMVGRGMKVAKDLYGSNDQQAHQFLRAYIQNGGNMGKAIETVGPPQDKANWSTVDLMRQGDAVLAQVDQFGNVRIPTDAQGQTYQRPGRGGAGDGETALVKNIKYFVGAGIAATPEEAAAMLSEAKTSPYKRAELIQKIYDTLKDGQLTAAEPMSDADLWQQAQDRIDNLIGSQRGATGQPQAPVDVAGQGGGQYPAAPQDPAQWQQDTVYQTPKGPARYLGNDEWELLPGTGQ